MDWTDIQITVATGDTERAADIAREVVPGGVYIEDYSDMLEMVPQIAHIDLIDEELLERSKTASVLHIYISPEQNPSEAISYLADKLGEAGIANTVATAGVREEDWANAWKAFYHPTRLGDRIVVCPSWESYDRQPGDLVLIMDPGMAFGSGTHQTTKLCCSLLEEYVTPGCAALDMGCGSGILSIAALLLGAGRAVGVDIDPVAVRTALENTGRNGVAGRFSAYCGDLISDAALGEKLGVGYDVIAANIVADVIMELKEQMALRLREGGVVVASGIIDERADEVVSALEAAGFTLLRRQELDGWCALVMRKGR